MKPRWAKTSSGCCACPASPCPVSSTRSRGLPDALANPPDLVLLDMRMPGMSGEEVFARLHEAHPGLPIIFLTAFGSVEGAVVAMRNGAFDYLQKPFKREDLLLVVNRALSHASLEHEVAQLKGRLEALGETDAAQSRSPAMLDQMDKCRRAAATDATVMILGESGTGKEVTARFIHNQSRRKDGPFVPVECSAMPGSLIESELFGYERGAFTGAERTKKGLIESADGGTLFLDEIGDLGVELQTRLFRFVEERALRRLGGLSQIARGLPHSLRHKSGSAGQDQGRNISRRAVLSAERGDREAAAASRTAGRYPHLARFFLERFSRRYGKSLSASPQFYEALMHQRWPGNVRQLKNVMERLTALHPGGVLGPRTWRKTYRPPMRRATSPRCPGRMRANVTWPALSRVCASRAGPLRGKHQRRGARSRRRPEDLLRAAQARS